MLANDNLTPRERLAKIVAEETDDGRRVVRFFVQAAEGQLHHEGFQACHRMDAAKELVKIGLTEFSDYIRANSAPPKPRARTAARPEAGLSPEIREAREQLAAYARELTQDGRTVIRMYAEVMEGVRNDEGFKPHHRIAAARELIKRGFDYDPATPEVRPDEDPELITDEDEREAYLESPENMAKVMEIIKRRTEQITPEEREAAEAEWRGRDLSMWETIAAQPPPVITREQARIEYAKLREKMEIRKTWAESDVKIPDPPEGLTGYDDP